MTHGYRTLQNWNQWLAQQFLGGRLLEAEQQSLTTALKRHLGKHALLIGVSHQYPLLESTLIPCHSLVSPLAHREDKFHYRYIEGDFHELPILAGTIDLVILPHTLEWVDNPRQVLMEASRVIKPEGLIAICGFNPYSIWGLRKRFAKHKRGPWVGNFLQAQQIKNWLHLADFEMEEQRTILFRPPVDQPALYQKLHFMEQIGSRCLPIFGGVYVMLARAKVIPLTPIRLKWKQNLRGIRISTTISGHIAQQSK